MRVCGELGDSALTQRDTCIGRIAQLMHRHGRRVARPAVTESGHFSTQGAAGGRAVLTRQRTEAAKVSC
jgi:hypothetical protein